MVAHTYTSLKSALLDYTEDDSDEYASNLDLIIQNAQDRLQRDLDLEIFKAIYTGTFTIGNNYINKPSGMLIASSLFYLNSSNKYIALEPKTFDWCQMYSPDLTLTGEPKYWCEAFSADQIMIVRTPSSAYQYKMRGLKRPDYLSSSVADNWISRHAGDLLLYVCLIESEGFLMASQSGRVQEWEAEYMKRIPQARIELGQLAKVEYSPQQSNNEAR